MKMHRVAFGEIYAYVWQGTRGWRRDRAMEVAAIGGTCKRERAPLQTLFGVQTTAKMQSSDLYIFPSHCV